MDFESMLPTGLLEALNAIGTLHALLRFKWVLRVLLRIVFKLCTKCHESRV